MGAKKQMTEIMVSNSLKDLKKIIKRKRSTISKRKSAEKLASASDDNELFMDAMKEVQEIKEFRQIPVRYRKHKRFSPRNKRDLRHAEALNDLKKIVEGHRNINLPDTQEYIEWINRDYKDDLIKKLHEGKYCVQDSLDIHGLIVEEAEIEVGRFITESLRKGYHCVKIIHGRGLSSPRGPVLKQAVVKWLSGRFRKYIIAFVTARQCDGGLGALYILLR